MKRTSHAHTSKGLSRLAVSASALLLSTSILLGGLPVAAVGGETSESAAVQAESLFDAPTTAALSPATLLSHVLGQPLTHEEKLWLETEAGDALPAGLSLTYDCTIPHENILLSYGEDGILTVTAPPYVGETLGTVWTPVSVTLEEEDYPLTEDGNGTHTAQLTASGLVTVTVNYETALNSTVESINTLVNAAYRRGQELLAAYADYEKALDDHAAATEAYNAYRIAFQQYKTDLALYNAYLAAKKTYDSQKAAYDAYLAELAAYEQAMLTYEAYLSEKAAYDEAYATYTDFLANPAAYEQKYLAYCAWLADMDKIKAQLAVMDSCFVRDSAGHMLNATLNGPTVATVVSRQDELVSVGCDAKDISNADAATEALIALLKDYPKDGTDAERYAYYIRHYAAIRDNVTLLYSSLSRLYGNDAVPDILQMQGKKERYWQFVAQLYALSCALEDGTAFDKSWSIADGKLTELLEDCFILTDTNSAAPLAAYPAPMEEVTSPAEMKKPVAPTVVAKPVAPLRVTQPTPPEEVKKPALPAVVHAPGQKPVAPIFSACETALAQAVKGQQLTERNPISGAVAYPLTLSVDKSVSDDSRILASFYNYDRMTLLSVVTADDTGLVAFPDLIPTRPAIQGHTYTFSGWMDGSGRAYPATDGGVTVTESTFFYAVYTTEKETYTVTWNVDGSTTKETYAFGEIPDFDGVPEKAPDEKYIYSFVGWSPVITPVSGNVTYEAVFAAHERVYEVQWVVGESVDTEEYPAGELPVAPLLPELPMDGRYRYVFTGWSPEITEVSGDTVYTAVFEAIDLLQGAEGGQVTVADGTVTVTLPKADGLFLISVSHAVAYAAEQNSGLTLTVGHVSLSFGIEDTARLAETKAHHITLADIEKGSSFSLRLLDASGTEISLALTARITVTIPEGQGGMITDTEGKVISTEADDTVTATIESGMIYILAQGYRITTEVTVEGTASDTGGLIHLPADYIPAGQAVTLTVATAPGYGIHTVILHDQSGAVLPCTDHGDGSYSFTMPEGRVSVTADLLHLSYTVTFTSGGQLISSAVYRYGETPAIPADPIRESDDEYSYTFTGWSPTVTAVMGDVTYEATFLAVPLGGQDSVEESKMGLVELFFLGFGVFAVTCAGIITPYVIVSKKKSTEVEKTEIK